MMRIWIRVKKDSAEHIRDGNTDLIGIDSEDVIDFTVNLKR